MYIHSSVHWQRAFSATLLHTFLNAYNLHVHCVTLITIVLCLSGRIVPQKAKMTLHKLRQQHEDTDIPDYPDYCNTELISYHSKVTSPPTLSSTRATTTATTASSEDRHTNSMSPDNGVLLVSKQTTVWLYCITIVVSIYFWESRIVWLYILLHPVTCLVCTQAISGERRNVSPPTHNSSLSSLGWGIAIIMSLCKQVWRIWVKSTIMFHAWHL